jgi:hypothetical protein
VVVVVATTTTNKTVLRKNITTLSQNNKCSNTPHERSRGSSVSIVSGYGLDEREIEVRYPEGAKDFSSSLCVQTGSGAHPDTCTTGNGSPLPRAKKQGRGVALTAHSSQLFVNLSVSYNSRASDKLTADSRVSNRLCLATYA